MQIQKFKYKLLQVIPIEDLSLYQDHRRMRVFFHKGLECTNPKCNRKVTKLAIGLDPSGVEHIDAYTDNLYPFTIDHWIPKSKGGSDALENLVPMCYGCNQAKGAKTPKGEVIDYEFEKGEEHLTDKRKSAYKGLMAKSNFCSISMEDIKLGRLVFKRRKSTVKFVGVTDKIVKNPHTGLDNFMVVGNDHSMYNFCNTFVVLEDLTDL